MTYPTFPGFIRSIPRWAADPRRGLEQLKARGVKTIISLRHNHSQVLWEEREAKSLGMNFKLLSLDGLHKPRSKTVKEFLQVAEDPANQPVFVHCQWGLDRTGTLIAIYRQEIQKWSAQKAYDEMVDLGFETKYVWLADAVFDYEQYKIGTRSNDRPMRVKMLDAVEAALHLPSPYRDEDRYSSAAQTARGEIAAN